jgi:release factor glutamine methyltransferase
MDGFVYDPAEDSVLLSEAVEYARGDVLELFAGKGVVGLEAAKKAKSVTFADINQSSIKFIDQKIEENGLTNCKTVISDLFSDLAGLSFDVIYMNPPYLPGDRNGKDAAELSISGGKDGYELTIEALKQSKQHLKEGGEIYLIISTVYDVRKVYKALESINFEFKVLDRKKFFFEELLLVKIYEKRGNNYSERSIDSGSTDKFGGPNIQSKER